MDAQLETIGARCHYCARQDFLPFQCAECTHSFCLNHSAPTNHACPVHKSSSSTPQVTQVRGPSSTISSGKSLKSLQAEHLARRQPLINTRRQAQPTLSSPSQDALKALKSLGSSFQLRGKSSTVAKTNVGIIRLKNLAKGDATIPVERRRYISIHHLEKVVPFYVDQQWSVGRTLDAVAQKMSLVNDNARTHDESRRLHLLCGGIVLEPSQLAGKLINDGDAVTIFRGVRPM